MSNTKIKPVASRSRRVIAGLLAGAALSIGAVALAPAANAYTGSYGCMNAIHNSSYNVITTSSSLRLNNLCTVSKRVQVRYQSTGYPYSSWTACETMPSRSTRDWNATMQHIPSNSGSTVTGEWQYC